MKKRNGIKAMAMGMAVLTALSLGACSKGEGASGAKGGTTTLSFGIWDEKQRPTMEAMIQAYEKTHENVKIEIQLTPYKGGEYWTKLEAAATGGTAPDVFWLNVLHAEDYNDGGILLDLKDYAEKAGLDLKSNFPESLVKAYTFGDKLIAIPKDFDTNALWYNKELFDKAGVAYPTDDWTYEDLVKACKDLTAGGLPSGAYPFACPIDFQTWYYPTVYAAGGWILNEDKTETGYTDPKTQAGIQCWIDLINDGYSPSAAALSETTADAMFEGGQLAMTLAGSYMTPEYTSNDAINTKINLVEFPEYNGVEPNIINGLGYAVYSGSKNKDAAADFALWMGGEEAMKIQGESGVVISARNDAQKYFGDSNKDLNLAAYTNHSGEANPLPVCKSVAEIYDLEAEALKAAYSGEKPLADVCTQLKTDADAILAKNKK